MEQRPGKLAKISYQAECVTYFGCMVLHRKTHLNVFMEGSCNKLLSVDVIDHFTDGWMLTD